MCKKTQFKYCPSKIDECMENAIFILNKRFNLSTVSCCCGHKRYPMTIVIKDKYGIYELFSGVEIPRKKRFYRKDKRGYYFIPEVIKC